MIRGTGYVAGVDPTDEERARHIVLGAGLLGAEMKPEGGVWREIRILDQFDSEACTKCFGAECVYALYGYMGSFWPGWYLARFADGGPANVKRNVGVSIASMIRTLERHGISAADSWGPGSSGFSYFEPPPAMARISGQQHKLDIVPIWADGDARVDALCAALSEGLPCGLVVEVDDRFERPIAGMVLPESGRSRGRHMITLWRFRTNDEGEREFLCVNSWGKDYGINGTSWLCEDRIRSAPFVCFARAA